MIIFAVGSTDRLFYRLHISYTAQIHFWRAGVWVLPVIVFFATRSICRSLQRSGAHPLRGWQGEVVAHGRDGHVDVLAGDSNRTASRSSEPPIGTVPGHDPGSPKPG